MQMSKMALSCVSQKISSGQRMCLFWIWRVPDSMRERVEDWTYRQGETHMLAVLAVVLLLAASLCSVSTRGLKVILLASGAFLFVAGVSVSIALLVVAPTLQPSDWAVRKYDTEDLSEGGLPNLAYMFLVGSLMGQATFIGLPAPSLSSAHASSSASGLNSYQCSAFLLSASGSHVHCNPWAWSRRKNI